MRETHAEQGEDIQHFWAWYRSPKTRQPGLNGSGHGTPCEFIPLSAVQQYLGTPRRVEALLSSIFRDETNITIDADLIRHHYLRSLAILLIVGKGPMIQHFVKYRSLQDHYLPHRIRPADFPWSSDPTFFEHFSKEQWQFCAMDLEYNMHHDVHKDDIFPITLKAEIGCGGNAVIFRINVHEEYNKLVPHRWEMPRRPPHLQQTFVLKTYQGRDAKEQHDAEREAFIRLRYDGEPSPFVIAYYGSFVDHDTYNIILEYADRGNLDNFMNSTPAPSTREDLIEYWDRLCYITHGLAHIHGLQGDAQSGSSVLLGWHQDIKPANILVFSGSGVSKYDVYFKIADLSLCHFKHSELLPHEDSDLDVFGTRAYGAPETFRPDDEVKYFPVQVRRDVDIWSIGCVFSEAAVWSRFGWEGVLEYRRLRQAEVKTRQDLDGEQLFHDGRHLLQAVHDTHKQILENQRDMDLVTVEILRLLNKDMLLSDGKPRYSARGIFHESRSIIKKARRTPGISTANIPSRRDESHESLDDLEGPPKTPPSVPPGYFRGSSSSAWSKASTPIDTVPSAGSTSTNSARSFSPGLVGLATSHQQNYRPSPDGPSQQSANLFGPFRSQSFDRDQLPDPSRPGSIKSHESESALDKSNALHLGRSGQKTSLADRRPHRETLGNFPNRVGRSASNEIFLHRSQTENGTSGHRRRKGVKSPSEPRSLKQETSAPLTPFQSYGPKSFLEAANQASSRTDINRTLEEPQRPHVNLQEALSWKQNRKEKKEGYQEELAGHENLASLDKRDHIFVIDNSGSMRAHRSAVLDVVSLLSYLLKDLDDDGLDVCFTQSTERRNSGRATKLSEVVGRVAFTGISDMRTRLSQILQEYKDKFGTSTASSRWWYKRQPKPLSFYVLTDGKWNPNEVGPTIKSLVNSMRELKLPKDHVGIQFIRFGQDPNGIARLDHLDHGLGLKEMDMDIVDTTAWDGNIWKQLLGAISSWYDDDPD